MNAAINRHILIVDDELLFAKAVAKRLRKAGFDCQVAGDLASAKVHLQQQHPDLLLLDMRLPDGSGLDFLAQLRNSEHKNTNVVVITAFGEVDDAVAAMKYQALDYLKKPIDLEDLLTTIASVLNHASAKQQPHDELSDSIGIRAQLQILGKSPASLQLNHNIQRIAALSSKASGVPPTVLICGETGTGKDLAARCLHAASTRAQRPFVHVDCAALPKDLIEAELFGHEKGAFTSATSARVGLLENAGDGTVFLDEIAELALDLQAKLLAVLERRKLRRVGSSREQTVPAWFIAATNRNVDAMVKAGEFRSDLYYRLKVMPLTVPALRERGDDCILLARHFAATTATQYHLAIPEFDASVVNALRTYSWPGNIRELQHVMERAVLLNEDQQLTAEQLNVSAEIILEPEPFELLNSSQTTLGENEIALIQQALEHSEGNVSQAARRLGITRMTLRYRMQKYNISNS